LPEPFSPTKNVTDGEHSSTSSDAIAGTSNGKPPGRSPAESFHETVRR
jgi:hypothetical protein